MTLLIADSGSTKTEWILTDGLNQKKLYKTKGMNPYFCSKEQISSEVGVLKQTLGDVSVDRVYFYGAGCSNPSMAAMVKEAIAGQFQSSEVEVNTDLLASAKACFMDKKGIACILGTGSNSCVYDGGKIIEQIPSLGFALGDEGSGGYFGKRLVRNYYYNIMPEELKKSMEAKFDMNLETTLDFMYRKPRGNAYIASFAYLLADFSDHPYVQKIVEKGFKDFVKKQLFYFNKHNIKNVGFVGSIAAIHKNILQKVLEDKGFELEIVVRKPIDRLVESHLAETSTKPIAL